MMEKFTEALECPECRSHSRTIRDGVKMCSECGYEYPRDNV